MQINRVDSIQSNGGAVSNKAVGTAFIGVGLVTSGVWNIGSSIHTLVAAPVVSLVSLGTAGALAGTGVALHTRKPQASKQTVDTTASAVA